MRIGNLQLILPPLPLPVVTGNFGLNYFLLQKERASHSGHLSSLACNNLVLYGKRWCQVNALLPSPVLLQGWMCASWDGGHPIATCPQLPGQHAFRRTTGRSGSSAFEGHVASSNTRSCKTYPMCNSCSNSTWLKSACDEWLGFRGEKLQCKHHSVLLLRGQRDTDECPQHRDLCNDALGLGYV